MYIVHTWMQVGRLFIHTLLQTACLFASLQCKAVAKQEASAALDGYGEIGHISSVCKLPTTESSVWLAQQAFLSSLHSQARKPWFAQRCDLHAANRVQTSLCIQRFRLRSALLFMLLTKVGTTWEISGLMNLILSLHFARVFCNAAQ